MSYDYEVRVLECSVKQEYRLLGIKASHTREAAIIAATIIFGHPIVEEDLSAARVMKYWIFNTNKFEINHKRVDSFHCLLEVNCRAWITIY